MNTANPPAEGSRKPEPRQGMLEKIIALAIVAKAVVTLLVASGPADLLVPEVRHAAAEQGLTASPATTEPEAITSEGASSEKSPAAMREVAETPGMEVETEQPQSFEAKVDLLLEIERKRAALRREQEALAQRAHWLLQLKADIERRVAELEELRADLQAIVDRHQAEEDRKLLHLVKVYESMRPEQAAPLIDGLDDELVVQIFSRMREKQAAKILEYVDPARGVSISHQIAPRQGQ